MKFEEALPLARGHQKICHPEMGPGQYWTLADGGALVIDQDGVIVRPSWPWLLSDQWQVFQEPLTMDQILADMSAKKDALVAKYGDAKNPVAQELLAAFDDVESKLKGLVTP